MRWRLFSRFSWAWLAYERFSLRVHPLQAIRDGSLFRVRAKGHVLELHLDGQALARMRAAGTYSAFSAVKKLREDLAALAARIASGDFDEVDVIKGTSLVGAAGGVLGFHTRMRPRSLMAALEQYFLVGIDAVYHPQGLRSRATRRWPVETWMTKDELLARYATTVMT